MICDFDDFSDSNNKLDRLHELKRINPEFKATLFAVPGLCSPRFLWRNVPPWLELAVHGWLHPDPHECSNWTANDLRAVMDTKIVRDFFVQGFKAPGWQISDGCYGALLEAGWWVADQHLEDNRRPVELRTYFYEDSEDRWHGHIQDVCGNGIEETWPELNRRVREADEFQFCSEALN